MALKLDPVTPDFCTVFMDRDHLGYVHREDTGPCWKACAFEDGVYRPLEAETFEAKEAAAEALLRRREATV
jgi:hypothetical protein